ncbi:MAG: hypothetical protein AAF310_00910 [Myxococcota bacterium]
MKKINCMLFAGFFVVQGCSQNKGAAEMKQVEQVVNQSTPQVIEERVQQLKTSGVSAGQSEVADAAGKPVQAGAAGFYDNAVAALTCYQDILRGVSGVRSDALTPKYSRAEVQAAFDKCSLNEKAWAAVVTQDYRHLVCSSKEALMQINEQEDDDKKREQADELIQSALRFFRNVTTAARQSNAYQSEPCEVVEILSTQLVQTYSMVQGLQDDGDFDPSKSDPAYRRIAQGLLRWADPDQVRSRINAKSLEFSAELSLGDTKTPKKEAARKEIFSDIQSIAKCVESRLHTKIDKNLTKRENIMPQLQQLQSTQLAFTQETAAAFKALSCSDMSKIEPQNLDILFNGVDLAFASLKTSLGLFQVDIADDIFKHLSDLYELYLTQSLFGKL